MHRIWYFRLLDGVDEERNGGSGGRGRVMWDRSTGADRIFGNSGKESGKKGVEAEEEGEGLSKRERAKLEREKLQSGWQEREKSLEKNDKGKKGKVLK